MRPGTCSRACPSIGSSTCSSATSHTRGCSNARAPTCMRHSSIGSSRSRPIDAAVTVGDRGLELTAKILFMELEYTTDPEEVEGTIVEQVQGMIPELEALEHHEGLARAWRLLMIVHEMSLRIGQAEAAAQR